MNDRFILTFYFFHKSRSYVGNFMWTRTVQLLRYLDVITLLRFTKKCLHLCFSVIRILSQPQNPCIWSCFTRAIVDCKTQNSAYFLLLFHIAICRKSFVLVFLQLLHKFAVWGRLRISLLNKRNSSVLRSAHETVLVRSVSLPLFSISRSLIFVSLSWKDAYFNPASNCSRLTYHAVTGLFTDN